MTRASMRRPIPATIARVISLMISPAWLATTVAPKIHVKERTDRILGATVVASHAGDMINEITLAIVAGIGLSTLARVIHLYPTQAEAIKKAADAYSRTRLTPAIQSLLRRWLKW